MTTTKTNYEVRFIEDAMVYRIVDSETGIAVEGDFATESAAAKVVRNVEEVNEKFQNAFDEYAKQDSDLNNATENAREDAAALVGERIFGTFHDESLTFTLDSVHVSCM